MEKSVKNWIDYWNTEASLDDVTLRKNMEIFIGRTKHLLNYNKNDVILDIGCGPGYFEYFLENNVREIHCTDTSKRYIDMCKKRFMNSKNLFFYILK